jgi:hypothetical protein
MISEENKKFPRAEVLATTEARSQIFTCQIQKALKNATLQISSPAFFLPQNQQPSGRLSDANTVAMATKSSANLSKRRAEQVKHLFLSWAGSTNTNLRPVYQQ